MPTVPKFIGKYAVVDRLGEGGMGTLYLGRDPTLDRLVAIKVLRGDFEDEGMRERFSREARAISRLRHPNIVTIFEYGEFEGEPFIAMEYVAGESLAETINRRAELPLPRKLRMMDELCAGMAYAHRCKIVHRDLKPANIMIDSEVGLIKILDFGIARNLDAGATSFTQVVGTPRYMSPEQAIGGRVDHRSDIFAIGAVFYELLSYQRAFDGQSQAQILYKIANEAPPQLGQVCPGLDLLIVRIVSRALEKDSSQRYQDLEAMRADLQRALERIVGAQSQGSTMPFSGAGLVTPATPRPTDQLEKRRASQIRIHLDRATQAIAGGDYDSAIEACEQVLLLDATNAQAGALVERARAGIEQRAIAGHLQNAREHLRHNALTAAEEALADALKLKSSDPGIAALQGEVQRARQNAERARERAAAASQAIARARASLSDGAFESALRAASEALAYGPDSPEARALKEQALAAFRQHVREEGARRRATDAVLAARRQFEAGQHVPAIEALERFDPPHPEVEAALADLRAQRDVIVQRRAAQAEQRRHAEEERRREEEAALRGQMLAKLSSAAAFLESSRPDEALTEVREALAIDGDHDEARRLEARIEAVIAERRRLKDLERRAQAFVDQARLQFDAGNVEEAISTLQQYQPQHAVVAVALDELRARADDAARAQEADRRRLEIERLLALARDRVAKREWTDALREIRGALEIDRDHEDALALQTAAVRGQGEQQQLERERKQRELEQRVEAERLARRRHVEEETQTRGEREASELLDDSRQHMQRTDRRGARESIDDEHKAHIGLPETLVGTGPSDIVVERAMHPPRVRRGFIRVPLVTQFGIPGSAGAAIVLVVSALIYTYIHRGPNDRAGATTPVTHPMATSPTTTGPTNPSPIAPPPSTAKDPDPLTAAAREFLAKGNLQEATGLITNGLKQWPDDRGLHGLMQNALRAASDRAGEARRSADRALASNQSLYIEGVEHVQTADRLRRGPRAEEAVREYLTGEQRFRQAETEYHQRGSTTQPTVTSESSPSTPFGTPSETAATGAPSSGGASVTSTAPVSQSGRSTAPDLPSVSSTGPIVSPPSDPTDTQGILDALNRFNAAFEAAKAHDLRAVWPNVPDNYVGALGVGGTTTIMQLKPIGEPTIKAGTAEILCQLATRVVVRGRPIPQPEGIFVVALKKSGDTWLIDRLLKR